MINISALSVTIFLFIAYLFLGLIVYSYDRRNKINVSLAVLVFAAAINILSIGIFFGTENDLVVNFMAKTGFACLAIILSALGYLCTYLPQEKPRFFNKALVFFALPGACFFIATLFSPLLIRETQIIADIFPFNRGIIFGLLFYPFVAFSLFVVFLSFLLLYEKHAFSHGLNRIQIRYAFFSVFLIGIFGVTASSTLLFFSKYVILLIQTYFILFGSGLLAYTILNKRIVSIEFLIQNGIIYTLITFSIMLVYFFSTRILGEIFPDFVFYYYSYYGGLISVGLTAIITAATFKPMERWFRAITDKLFFRERYDYQKMLQEVSQAIASVIKLEQLLKLIISIFIYTIKVSEASFLLYDKTKNKFRSVPLEPKAGVTRYKRIEIDEESHIVSWLKANRDILIKDEIEREAFRTVNKQDKELEEIKNDLEKIGVAVWVPVVSKNQLIGIITLGEKLSGDTFTSEDLGLLTTLANQTALALDNVRLYQEVVQMKNYNENILKFMVNGILTTDLDGKIITFNSMAERITGLTFAEVIGKNCKEVWGEKDPLVSLILKTAVGASYTNLEANIYSKDKVLVPIDVSTVLLKDSKGNMIGVLASITDKTQMKLLETRLRQADKLSALGTMAAGMAHEIKNPLSSMKVLSELLSIKFEDPKFRGKFIEIVPREIDRINRIVESLLDFARATALKFEPCDVKLLIEETLDYLKDRVEGAEIKLIKQLADAPKVSADIQQLSQVFTNLFVNAIQAMQGGGQLTVILKEGKRTQGIVEEITIEISDTGHGIPPENLKKLFDPFFTTKYGGTGLGLTITHSIIDGHKGSIEVESTVGKGTTFYITLPVSQ